MKSLTEKQIKQIKDNTEFSISLLTEHTHRQDMLEDQESIDKILSDLEWNEWAWTCVKVTATFEGIEGTDYLGCCSYENEKDFISCGYYEDMKAQAMEELLKKIESLQIAINA